MQHFGHIYVFAVEGIPVELLRVGKPREIDEG